jgi:hypothetical protein
VAEYDPMLMIEQLLSPFPDSQTARSEERISGEELRALTAMLLGDDADHIIMRMLGRREVVVEQMWEPYCLVPRYLAVAVVRLCRAIVLINQMSHYYYEVPKRPEFWPLYEQMCGYFAQPANLMPDCGEEELYSEVGNALVKLVLARARDHPYDIELFRDVFGQLEEVA